MAKNRRRRVTITAGSPCPCGLDRAYGHCCGRLHSGEAAATAELLMRSRFSAFAVADEAYLLRSWHPATRPSHLRLDPDQRWIRLEIVGKSGGGPLHAEGTVEFRAHYSEPGGSGLLHENSRFVRDDGRWVYLSAIAE
jgi:SEC-C motif-containing protein